MKDNNLKIYSISVPAVAIVGCLVAFGYWIIYYINKNGCGKTL